MRRTFLLLSLPLLLTACGHAPPAGQHSLDVDKMQLQRDAARQAEVLEAVRGAELARLARAAGGEVVRTLPAP